MARKDPLVSDDGPRLADGHRPTDVGNGDRLVAAANGRLRYVRKWKTFVVYHEGVWIADVGDVLTREMAKTTIHNVFRLAVMTFEGESRNDLIKWAKQSESSARLSAMLLNVKGTPGVLIEHTELDQHPELLNVVNGVINLRTGELLRHDPDYLFTRQLRVRYEPRPDDVAHEKACIRSECADVCVIGDPKVLWRPRSPAELWRPEDSPLWARCLGEWQPDQKPQPDQPAGPLVRDYLQECAGAGATGYSTQRFDIHWGDGGNGKGAFFEQIMFVLDEYAVVPHKSLIVRMHHEQHETVMADLFGARLAVAAETNRDQHLDEEKIKNLTGGDTLSARRMKEDRWKFRPTHSLHLHTNYKPVIKGTDEGIWRRVNLVPWTQSFMGSRENEELPQQLRKEAEGTLRWIVAGAVRWLGHGRKFTVPTLVSDASERYRSSASPTHAFLIQWTVRPGSPGVDRMADLFVTSETIHDAYVLWRITYDHEVVPPWLSKDQLVKELTDRGFIRDTKRLDDGQRLRGLRGIALRSDVAMYVEQQKVCCSERFNPTVSDLARSVQNAS